MIRIVSEDSVLNQELSSFPTANANIAIFGTQSSGKSTLLNHVFGSNFPVLDTLVARQRCTKGIWLQNINGFNLIDTEGFDSIERGPEYKMYQKQLALFCLALSDVLIINMWMNQIGRYEASHSHILKAIIKASQRVIASQQRKIIVAVRDCTEDADRTILRNELNDHIQDIIKSESKKSTLKFTLNYVMMSHFEDNQKQFKKQAKDILRLVSNTKKSNLNHYNDQDRLVYVKKLWENVTSSQSQIDLRTVEDALQNYTLQRIKNQTLLYMQIWLQQIQDLSKYTSHSRLKQAADKEIYEYFMRQKPKHIKSAQIQSYLAQISILFYNQQNKYFLQTLLPNEQERLIKYEYQLKLDVLQKQNVGEFKKNMIKIRRYLRQTHRTIVDGLKDSQTLTERFINQINIKDIKYDQLIQHLQNLFKIELQDQLNKQIHQQTKSLLFDAPKLNKIIAQLEDKYKYQANQYLSQIWSNIIDSVTRSLIIQKIRQEGEIFNSTQLGVLMGSQTQYICQFYKSLQAKAEIYLSKLMSYNQQIELPANLQAFQSIRKQITELMKAKLIEESRQFKFTLAFTLILMFLFFSEFKWGLKLLGVGKKRMKRWIMLYTGIMATSLTIIIYRNIQYFKKIFKPPQ